MATKNNSGLWGWVQDVGKTCGFAQQPQPSPMWVRATPNLFPQEVPGMCEDLLAQVNAPGGSPEEKIEAVIETFRNSARHLESLQQVLRKRSLEQREKTSENTFPAEVEDVIAQGNYVETFLQSYDGQSFLLHSEEIVPGHEYRLALEVHSGGAYWSNIPVQDTGAVRQKVETVGASSSFEGSATILSHYGAAQRGAVFVWRWHHLLDQGPYNLPEWLSKALLAEGNDPLRKLQSELESIRRWEQQVTQDTSKHVKTGTEVKDPYIKEVLRLWPSEPDPQGGEQLKKCAWVEGLDPRLFTGRTVLVHRTRYDQHHALALHATISKRHQEEAPQEGNPPYRLTTSWHWAAAAAAPIVKPEAAAISSSREPVTPSRPDTLGSRPGTAMSAISMTSNTFVGPDHSRPGSAMSANFRPDTLGSRPGTAMSAMSMNSNTFVGSEYSRPGSVATNLTVPGTSYSELTRPGTGYSGMSGYGSAGELGMYGGQSPVMMPPFPQPVR